jgi:hypothetical protein
MDKKPRFLKSRGGKLASEYHGETGFSRKRKESIIKEQEERERESEEKHFGWYRVSDVKKEEREESIAWKIDLSN